MISLNDPSWKDFDGGYREKYDAAVPLSRLEGGIGELDSIWSELWENLHHQGDIGIASYAAIPHITRIIQERSIFNFNPFALAVTIELARGQGQNPELPDWLREEYFQALWDMAKYGCDNLNKNWDSSILKSVLSLVAIIKGNRDLGELIIEVDAGYEKDLLNKLFED
jgi:hypothetical protein